LKARAQHLNPVLKLGKAGLTPAFVTSLGQALRDHSLLKVKFLDFKDERHELAARLAAEAGCHLVAVIGHVAIFYQPPANPGPKKEST
jgi:RNA-binding protein